jgi:uncharacterized membrane protein
VVGAIRIFVMAVSRSTWVQLFLFLHIVGAIAAVGPTLTYAMWIARGEKQGAPMRAFAVRGTSWVDSHLATPAFMAQAVTGGFLVWLARFSVLHTAWLIVGISLYVIVTVIAVTVLSPVVRRRNDVADRASREPSNTALEAQYGSLAGRVRAIGITVAVLTVGILYVMIVKPALWSAG